jgi:hypothetical protein
VAQIVAYNHPEGAPEPCEYSIYLTSRYACPEVGAGSCSAVNDCASCGQVAGCGWCSLSQRCLAGSVDGPNTGSCYGPYWHYDEASNPCVRTWPASP